VNFDKSKTSLDKIENAITSAGYDANDKKADPKHIQNSTIAVNSRRTGKRTIKN